MGFLSMFGFGGTSAQTKAPAPAQTRGIMITYYGLGNYRMYEVPATFAWELVRAIHPHMDEPESINPKIEPGTDLSKARFEVRVSLKRGHADDADRAVLKALSKPGAPAEFMMTRSFGEPRQKVIVLASEVGATPGTYKFQLDGTGDRGTDKLILDKIIKSKWVRSVKQAPEYADERHFFVLEIDGAVPAEQITDDVTVIVELETHGSFTVGSNVRRSGLARR